MKIESLLETRSELTNSASPKMAVVLTTRVRLARNLRSQPFPGWAKEPQRRSILERCLPVVGRMSVMKRGLQTSVEELSELERQILFERHLISRELMQSKAASGVVISKDQAVAVMINEEDHLRLQAMRVGFSFKKVWAVINQLDSSLEEDLDYAFTPELGYLTACPSNVGTGLRASVMMHLPGLVMAGQMEKVIHAVNQIGIVVRGLFGEGSDASGSVFQISNQTTLGESEEAIIKRLESVLHKIVEEEVNAREKQLESEGLKLVDKIGRAYGLVQNAHVLASTEAMNLLSLIRLGVDLGVLPEEHRGLVDRLLIECQPGHVQWLFQEKADAGQRDVLRARLLRREFESVPRPDFKNLTH